MPKIYLIVLLAIVISAAGLLVGRRIPRQSPPTSSQLSVAATIFPLTDITRQIAGPYVQVIQIIPSNSDPHSFALAPQQIRQLSDAQVIFAIGHGLDNHVTDTALKIKLSPVITVDRNITLRPFSTSDTDHDARAVSDLDPHYWLTAPNAKAIAATIATELTSLDPAHAADYDSNLTAYRQSLDRLEANLQQQFSRVAQPNFIAVHDAWSYFAAHYGLSLVATYEPIEGQTPTINDLQYLRQLIKQYHIKTFYTEPAKTSSTGVRFMQEEFGLKIMSLDDLGGIVPDDSYINLMLRNMQAIAAAD